MAGHRRPTESAVDAAALATGTAIPTLAKRCSDDEARQALVDLARQVDMAVRVNGMAALEAELRRRGRAA